jgi:hypothetical protein
VLMLEISTKIKAEADTPKARSAKAAAFEKKVKEILDSFQVK